MQGQSSLTDGYAVEMQQNYCTTAGIWTTQGTRNEDIHWEFFQNRSSFFSENHFFYDRIIATRIATICNICQVLSSVTKRRTNFEYPLTVKEFDITSSAVFLNIFPSLKYLTDIYLETIPHYDIDYCQSNHAMISCTEQIDLQETCHLLQLWHIINHLQLLINWPVWFLLRYFMLFECTEHSKTPHRSN